MIQQEKEIYLNGVKDASNKIYKQTLPLVFELIKKYNIPTEDWTIGSSLLANVLNYFLKEDKENKEINVEFRRKPTGIDAKKVLDNIHKTFNKNNTYNVYDVKETKEISIILNENVIYQVAVVKKGGLTRLYLAEL
jgi:hypothetical protein